MNFNIDFDNSSSVILGYEPDILSQSSSGWAFSTHTHGPIAGTNISFTSHSNGLSLSVADPVTGSLALSDHSHGTIYTSAILGSLITNASASSGLTLGIPNFITTAAESDHTHSDLYIPIGNSTDYATSVLDNTFITTAALSNHTHGSFLGTSIWLVSSGSNGLALSVGHYLTTAMASQNTSLFQYTSATSLITADALNTSQSSLFTGGGTDGAGTGFTTTATAGTEFVGTLNSNGLRVGVPAFITTSPVQGIGGMGNTGSSNAFTSGSVIFSGITNITVNTSSNSNSQYIQLSVADAAAAANAFVAGNYLSASTDGVSTRVSVTGLLPTANTTNFITGVAASNASTLDKGLLRFSNSNNISFGLSGSTITASINAIGTEYSGYYVLTNDATSLALRTHIHGSISIATASNATNTLLEYSSASSGLTLSIPSWLTTAARSTHIHGSISIATPSNSTNTQLTYSSASSGLTLSVPSWLTTAANSTHTHGTVDIQQGSLVLNDSNGITFGNTISGYSTTITASYNSTQFASVSHTHSDLYQSTGSYLTTARASTDAIGLNTAKTNANLLWTVNSSGIQLDGSALAGTGVTTTGITGSVLGATLNTSGLSLGIPAWLTTALAGGAALKGSGSFSQNTGTIEFANSNNITFGLTNGSMTASGGFVNTSETGNVYFVNPDATSGSNITFGSIVSGNNTSIYATAGGGSGSADRFNILAVPGTTAASNATIVLSNSNGISFGINASTITASHNAYSTSSQLTATFAQTANVMLTGERASFYNTTNNTLANSTHNHGSISIASASATNVSTFAYSSASGGMTFSIPAWITTAMASNESHFREMNASNGSMWNGTVNLRGSSNITVSATNDTIYFSVADAIPLANSTKFIGSNTAITGGSMTGNSSGLSISIPQGSLYYVDSNGVSFGAVSSGLSTTITASYNSTSAGAAGIGLNTSISSGYSGSQLAMAGNSSGLTLSVPAWVTAAAGGGVALSASNSLWSAGTVVLTGSSNITVGTAAGSILLSVADAIPLGNSTAYNTTVLSGTFAQTGHTHSDLYIAKANSTQSVGLNTSSSSTSGVDLKFSLNSSGATFSVPAWITTYAAQSAEPRVVSINGTSGSLTFNVGSSLSSSQNGTAFTFGLASNITTALQSANANYLTVQSAEPRVISINGTSGSLSFSGGNNITISALNGSTYSIHGPASLLYALSLSGNSGTTGSNGIANSGFVLAGGNNISLSQSNNTISIIGGAGGAGVAPGNSQTFFTSGSIIFSGVNATINSSLGTGGSTASQWLQISVAAPGAAAENNWVTLSGNVAGNSSASGSTINFIGGNNITLSGTNNNQVRIDGPQASIAFSDGSGVSWGSSVDGSTTTITASVLQGLSWSLAGANSSGTNQSSMTNGLLYLSGGPGITLSGNSNTIIVSKQNQIMSRLEPTPYVGVTRTVDATSGSWWVYPFVVPQDLSFDICRILVSHAAPGAATTGTTVDGAIYSANNVINRYAVIYSQGAAGGANSRSLQYVTSGQHIISEEWYISHAAGAGSGSQNSGWSRIAFPSDLGSASITLVQSRNTASNAGYTISETWASVYSGFKYCDLTFGAASLSAGNYWVAFGASKSSYTNSTAATRLQSISANGGSQVGLSGANIAIGQWGQATNASNNSWTHGAALFTTNAQGTTASMGFTALSSSASHNVPYFVLMATR